MKATVLQAVTRLVKSCSPYFTVITGALERSIRTCHFVSLLLALNVMHTTAPFVTTRLPILECRLINRQWRETNTYVLERYRSFQLSYCCEWNWGKFVRLRPQNPRVNNTHYRSKQVSSPSPAVSRSLR